jgi:hypothetical protein
MFTEQSSRYLETMEEGIKIQTHRHTGFPLIRHGPNKNDGLSILLLLHVNSLPPERVYRATEPLPSNDGRGDKYTDTQTFVWYGMDRTENDASNISSVVACVLIAAGTCLPSCCLAKIKGICIQIHRQASCGSTIPAFRRYGGYTGTQAHRQTTRW